MKPGVSQEAMHSGTFATMGRFNHEHLPDKEQEDEDADDHNMTSAELSKVLLPEGAVTDILKSDEITSFIQNQFHDKAITMLTESLMTALKKTSAKLTKKEFDDVLMDTLNAANQAMFTANALSISPVVEIGADH